MPDPYGDPVANGVMDEAEGHTGGQGDYHYHALIESAFADADGDGVPDLFDTENAEQGGPSPILGFALVASQYTVHVAASMRIAQNP